MLQLPAGVVKTMPPRGPLQQYRVDQSVQFACHRCGQEKTSKLVTVLDGDGNRLVCNGCYGRLVALWNVKAGTLPDRERDDAILALLSTLVTAEDVERAQANLALRARHRQLSPSAQQMLATAEAVTTVLKVASDLDWSAAVIGLCKAVEVEVVRRVAEPLREATKGLDLASDVADKELSRLARYCLGRAPAPELGSLAYVLDVAARSTRRRLTSPLLKTLAALSERWADGDWIVGAGGLAAAARALSVEYRNPAAHTSVLGEQQFTACREAVQGERGLLVRLAEATLPRGS